MSHASLHVISHACSDAVRSSVCRAAGFSVVNQHPGLLVMATVWLREHNRRALEAAKNNPNIEDEEAFQTVRK